MDFSDFIKHHKPSITPSTLKTYNSLLRSIYKNVFGLHKDPDTNNFSRTHQVLAWLIQKPYNTRKTYLSALVCVVPNEPIYKKQMLDDVNEYNHEVSKSELTDKLEQSTIDDNEINEIANKLKHDAELLLKRKSNNVADLMTIQNYIILCLYHGFIVPRRSNDYVLMKFKNYTSEDNYIDLKKKKFFFNKFKTAKFKGTQQLDIPAALFKILSKWISVIPNGVDNLLFNSKLEPLSNVVLNQRLNSIFGKRASVNAMRHYYLTSKYKQLMKTNEQLAEDMDDMGSSKSQALVYIKIHDKK